MQRCCFFLFLKKWQPYGDVGNEAQGGSIYIQGSSSFVVVVVLARLGSFHLRHHVPKFHLFNIWKSHISEACTTRSWSPSPLSRCGQASSLEKKAQNLHARTCEDTGTFCTKLDLNDELLPLSYQAHLNGRKGQVKKKKKKSDDFRLGDPQWV